VGVVVGWAVPALSYYLHHIGDLVRVGGDLIEHGIDRTPYVSLPVFVGTTGVIDSLCIFLLLPCHRFVGAAMKGARVSEVYPRAFTRQCVHISLFNDACVSVRGRLLGRNSAEDSDDFDEKGLHVG
jgi:hypothetical protein